MTATLLPVGGSHAQALEGLRELAAFLDGHGQLPLPREITVVLAPVDDADGRRAIARAARELGVQVKNAPNGTLRAERAFGPVRYAVVYMPMLIAPAGGAR
ncbi:hypothetical protein KGA66_06165 [Actinocrinis puniceicyclus]|uniref:Uncharacterized protein n=1 Tax=Actinocrinis puniceicyclus TaxID=977794 RepID=A0A8J7WMM2_9ACTN|nr:hypothetical protein [Actinocrinis puniceicyclus]MBS2962624.1 hypothetical protein [Actinocrinis puniceicyclus]